MKVSIYDIAKKTGYCPATVSRALHDNKRISARTREAIKNAAFELGYYEDAIQAAARMRGECPLNIGVSFEDLSNPFCLEIIRGIEDACEINRCHAIIMDAGGDVEREERNLRNFRLLGVRGLLVNPVLSDAGRSLARADASLPCVFVGRQYRVGEASFVCANTELAAYRSTEYLIQLGHRRIAFAGASEKFFMRVQGFRGAMEAYRQPVWDNDVVFCAPTRLSGYNAMRDLTGLGGGHTAVVCVNDFVAIGVMEYLKRHGKRVPQDCSVVGMDNIDISSFDGVDLTTMHQPGYEMGKTAAELLIGQIKRGGAHRAEHRLLEAHFVIRKSCCPPQV